MQIKKNPRVLLNLFYLHPSVGGAWNYSANFIRALVKRNNVGEKQYFRLYAVCNPTSFELISDLTDEIVVHVDQELNPLEGINRIRAEHFSTHKYIKMWNIDLVHWFGNHAGWFIPSRVLNIVTLHDFQGINAEKQTRIKRWAHRILFWFDANRRNVVYAPISHSTCDLLQANFPNARFTEKAYPHSIEINDYAKLKSKDQLFAPSKMERDYVLYVSKTYPHKNHARLIRAFERYCEQLKYDQIPPLLVLRADPGAIHEEILKQIKTSPAFLHIRLLPRLTPLEMRFLYQNAKGIIFPSLFEGGGIPVLEGLIERKKIAVSHLPVFKEYYGDNLYYFDPRDLNAIVSGFNYLMSTEPNRTSEAFLVNIQKRFSMDNRGAEIVEMYKSQLEIFNQAQVGDLQD